MTPGRLSFGRKETENGICDLEDLPYIEAWLGSSFLKLKSPKALSSVVFTSVGTTTGQGIIRVVAIVVVIATFF